MSQGTDLAGAQWTETLIDRHQAIAGSVSERAEAFARLATLTRQLLPDGPARWFLSEPLDYLERLRRRAIWSELGVNVPGRPWEYPGCLDGAAMVVRLQQGASLPEAEAATYAAADDAVQGRARKFAARHLGRPPQILTQRSVAEHTMWTFLACTGRLPTYTRGGNEQRHRLRAPELELVEAVMQWVFFPNPVYGLEAIRTWRDELQRGPRRLRRTTSAPISTC